jgi:predicted aconitase
LIGAFRSLEVERTKWPKSGLDFAEQLLQVTKLKADSCLDVCHLQQSVTNKQCEELVIMTDSLRQLQQLKENHKISVALADFMQV